MTTKTLADFFEVYRPKSPDEQKFVDKHVVIKHKDRNGNGDDVFNAKNIKKADRKKERHGYEPGEDEKVYEEVEQVDEASNELMGLKNRIASNQKKMRAIPGIHPDKKRLAIQIEKDKKRHDELFNRMMGKNESIDEKTLTPDETKKREEVVKAVKRSDPKMDKSTAYAIATDTAKRVAEERAGDDEYDHYLGKFEYQHRSGRYVKARVSKHPEGGYQVHWADGSKSRKTAAEMAKTIRSGGLIPEEVESLDEASFHHYEISHPTIAPKGGEGAIVHIKGKPSTMRKHRIETGDVEGHYGNTRHFKVTDTKTGLTSNHSVYQSDYLPKTDESILSVRPKGSTGGHTTKHNKALAAYLNGKRKLTEDFEQIDEISSKVVKNYIKKAHAGQNSMEPDRKGGVEFDHRRKGLNLAYNFALPRNRASDKDAAQAAAKLARRQNELKRQGKVVEDFEQIDEISSKVVKAYLKKAWAGRDSMEPDRKGGVGFDHRRKGINLAYNFALPRNRQSDKDAAQAAAKLARRQNELKRQGKVLAKEGAEPVDEMRGTSYARPSKSFFRGPTAPSMPREKTEREKETDKGLAAIQAAFAKARKPKPVTAEELATSFIDRYIPEQADMPAPTNEEKLVEALMGQNIAEAIAADVLALHSTLDEQNQRLLIDNIMEGRIDEVVDFAIQNRN